MTQQPTIEAIRIDLPRLDDEGDRAYAARVAYLTMGAARSLEKVRQKIGTRSVRYIELWSVKYHWQEHAKRYDDAMTTLAIADAEVAYRRDLELHRERTKRSARDLLAIADGLAVALAQSLRGQVIRGADGRDHVIPAMEMTPAAVNAYVRALVTAADLNAHALQLDQLLPQLISARDDDSE